MSRFALIVTASALLISSVVIATNLPTSSSVPKNFVPKELHTQKSNKAGIAWNNPRLILFKSEDSSWGNEEPVFKANGVSYDRFPVSHLTDPSWVTAGYKIAWIPSNANGNHDLTVQENDPLAVKNMYDFVKAGGFLVVDMADNDGQGSYIAPGPDGKPVGGPSDEEKHKFWNNLPCENFGTITPIGLGHPIFKGLDTSTSNACWTNHGNLFDGQYPLPASAHVLWTQTFDDGPKPIVAEYDIGKGHVFVDTLTKEYWLTNSGKPNERLLSNILNYAVFWAKNCHVYPSRIHCGTPPSFVDSIQTGSTYTPRSYATTVSLPTGCPSVVAKVDGLTLCEKCDNTVPKVQPSYNCQVKVAGNLFNIAKTTPGAHVSWKVTAGGVDKLCGVCMIKIGSAKKVCQSAWTPGTHANCPDNIAP
jgi:hypothetical protein